MSDNPKKVKLCTLCGQPMGKEGIATKTKQGVIYMHLECFKAEQDALKTEKEDKEQ